MSKNLFNFLTFVSIIPLCLIVLTYNYLPLKFGLLNVALEFEIIYGPRMLLLLLGFLPILHFLVNLRNQKYDSYILRKLLVEQIALQFIFLLVYFSALGHNQFLVVSLDVLFIIYLFFKALVGLDAQYPGFTKKQRKYVNRFNFNITCFAILFLFIGLSFMVREQIILLEMSLVGVSLSILKKRYYQKVGKNVYFK